MKVKWDDSLLRFAVEIWQNIQYGWRVGVAGSIWKVSFHSKVPYSTSLLPYLRPNHQFAREVADDTTCQSSISYSTSIKPLLREYTKGIKPSVPATSDTSLRTEDRAGSAPETLPHHQTAFSSTPFEFDQSSNSFNDCYDQSGLQDDLHCSKVGRSKYSRSSHLHRKRWRADLAFPRYPTIRQ